MIDRSGCRQSGAARSPVIGWLAASQPKPDMQQDHCQVFVRQPFRARDSSPQISPPMFGSSRNLQVVARHDMNVPTHFSAYFSASLFG